MKKLLAVLLTIVLVFSLAACSKGGKGNEGTSGEETTKAAGTLVEGLTKEEYDKMKAEDLLKHVKDINNVTPDEYYWLCSTYAYVDIEESDTSSTMSLKDSITRDALNSLEYDAVPKLDTYVDKLLANPTPQVRGYAMERLSSLFGVSDANIARAKEVLKNEKEPYVQYCAIYSLRSEMDSDKDIADFIFRMADSEDFRVRARAAYAVGMNGGKVDGATEKVIEMMSDENTDVKKSACSSVGDIKDDKVIDALVKVLNNDAEYKVHGECVRSLVKMWYDYPSHKNTNERAYKETMNYFKKTPRTDDVPYWTSITTFRSVNEDYYGDWKKKATYFNTDEIYEVMVDIIKDENANWLGRNGAVDIIKAHCSKEQWKSLKKVVDGLTDSKADFIKSHYESVEKDKK